MDRGLSLYLLMGLLAKGKGGGGGGQDRGWSGGVASCIRLGPDRCKEHSDANSSVTLGM